MDEAFTTRMIKLCVDLNNRVKQLTGAIKEHAAQRLDDRCWLDDLKLYKLVGIESHPGLSLPQCEFLKNCERYWKSQQDSEKYEKQTSGVEWKDVGGEPMWETEFTDRRGYQSEFLLRSSNDEVNLTITDHARDESVVDIYLTPGQARQLMYGLAEALEKLQ